ncbi:MAG: hypothetical protein HY289_00265 [Planctomycetes bacterium]|nr:hypothetical protein [Planctomycetota bacterium]
MWLKLTGEYVNLDHIVRVRISKAVKNGQTDFAVELEGVIKGELSFFTRYRGIDAELVIHALEIQSRLEPAPADAANGASGPHQAQKNTVHDVKIM